MSGVQKDWIRQSTSPSGLERIEAFFNGQGYSPHRHDTYAIGMTLAGIHNFHYRGQMRHSLPGSSIVIFPDEEHDGEAGTPQGFHYRIAYIDPARIRNILSACNNQAGNTDLPFMPHGISDDLVLQRAISELLGNVETPHDPLQEDDALFDLTQALIRVSDSQRPDNTNKTRVINLKAARIAREYIHSCARQMITLDELEAICDQDRWNLSRDFRILFGTSPYRYQTMRRLGNARSEIQAGASLSDAAYAAGFTDQSHMSHHFKRAYGLTPARWRRILAAF
ncbi:AraC family transcriptional regulator [Oceanospirillum sediminis]|uniref:AraC family transcriptional regulator n=1 Tax=Oceanospirillum sediminis TaxID=2760088 RepID=A0A839INR8_9GAMM|nr:AraC family transcriptional regulator [Oceanospirillum sediminis]MBB1487133.1 AraC family transcriptional regulator [Oceanospirillum sediminis]